MQIKNPEKLLQRVITGVDGQVWQVYEVNKCVDVNTGPYYVFNFVTDISINNTMTRHRKEKAELRIFESDYAKNSVYELFCGNQVWHGYTTDIDTIDKFIFVLVNMLPKHL